MTDREPAPINDRVATRRWAVKLLREVADQVEHADEDALDEVVQRFAFADIERMAVLVFRGSESA